MWGFFDIVELDRRTDAETICNSLKESLGGAGMHDDFLCKNLISVATDGAAVLTGRET